MKADLDPVQSAALNAPVEGRFSELPPPPFWSESHRQRRADIRVHELILVALFAPLWLAAMALVTLWIRMVSSGPVIYREERIGRSGQRFLMYRFRTMSLAWNRLPRLEVWRANDRETTPLEEENRASSGEIPGGRFLRVSQMRELPQIFNFLKGEMSLFGSRPRAVGGFECFNPEHWSRLNKLPGILPLGDDDRESL